MNRNEYISKCVENNGNGYYFIVRNEKVIDCVIYSLVGYQHTFMRMGLDELYTSVEELNQALKSQENDLFVYYTTINNHIKQSS